MHLTLRKQHNNLSGFPVIKNTMLSYDYCWTIYYYEVTKFTFSHTIAQITECEIQ